MDRQASKALVWTARTGYAARGAVYLLIGVLVIWSCFHGGSHDAPGSRGALATLAQAPAGTIALYLIAAGLFAFAIWRFVEAIGDVDHRGHDGKALAVRSAHVISGLLHLGLALSALSIAGIEAAPGGTGGGGQQGWTAQLMQHGWGRWLVGIAGLVVIGFGIAQAVRGWKAKFLRLLKAGRAALGHLFQVCRFGLVARGFVFVVIGGMLIEAAVQYEPSQAGGLRAAFNQILEQPFGVFLLAVVGVGLVAFSVYSFIEARYRRIDA